MRLPKLGRMEEVMAGFSDILGHDKIKKNLMDAIEYRKVSHAYIFNGEMGSGKKMLARAFAMTLQCEKNSSTPCLECHSCKQAMSGNQPDIIWLKPEKPTSIGVTDVREQINTDIQIKPYSSRYKIYIVDDAQKLTIQAQNALLKTIEEPPVYGIVIFLTTNANTFLPTILSRCTMINLKDVDTDIIAKHLMKNYGIPDYQAQFCAQFAQGKVGRAIMIATDDSFIALKEEVVQVLRYVNEMQIPELIEAIKRAEKYKLNVKDYIDFMMLWYRDVLMYKATMDINRLMYKEEMNFIKKQAQNISYEGANNILTAMAKAKMRLDVNVNFELAMELMLLTLKENSKE